MNFGAIFGTTLIMVSLSLAVTLEKGSNQAVETSEHGRLDQVANISPRAIRDVRAIPGTRLSTSTFYKVSMKAYPAATFTWTGRQGPIDDYHYAQIDNAEDHAPNYLDNGSWSRDAQWEFIPVTSCSNSKWYRMRNRGRPNHYLTWSQTEIFENVTNYMILESNAQGIRSNHDFLVKPVRKEGYYQLKLKGLPNGVITQSSSNVYGWNQWFIMVDNSRSEDTMAKYRWGGELYDKTLFSFKVPGEEDEDDLPVFGDDDNV